MRYVTLVFATCLAVGCGGGRHPATPEEQALGNSVMSSSEDFPMFFAQGTIALPYRAAVLAAPLLAPDCLAGQETIDGAERMRFACNHLATDVSGTFMASGDQYTVDLHGSGMFALDFTAQLTARPDYLDGTISLSVASESLSTTSLSTQLTFKGLMHDVNGCLTEGGVVASLKAEVPGEDLDYAIDAVYGPDCGKMMVAN